MRQDFRENLGLALDTIRAHKLRSFLTVLGVMIGVGVIILVAALLAGFDRSVVQSITRFGADTAFISHFSVGPRIGRRSAEERARKPLTVEDGTAILEGCPAVKNLYVVISADALHTARYQTQEINGPNFMGTFPSYTSVNAGAVIKQGRFYSEAENEHRREVAVIGESIDDTLFPRGDAIGKELLVDGSPFEIIGVFEKPEGGFGDNDRDTRIIIPYNTFKKIFPRADNNVIRIQAYAGKLDLAVDQARDVLRRRRSVPYNASDNFSISTSQQMVEQFHQIIAVVAITTLVLSSIGLLVGGVGVMNIMLVSVTERTREIGVRKAIGARRRDITWQFLFEAVTLTTIGGIIGILVSGSIAMLIPMVSDFPAAVPMWAVVLGLTVCAGVGLIFGTWPAIKAARLDPVEALRYE